ncbi:MAG: hypothetical protein AAF415_18970 [Pseudomonadota bacterium]
MSKGKKPEIIDNADDKTGDKGAETPPESTENQALEGETTPTETDAGTGLKEEAAASDTPEDAPDADSETSETVADDSPEAAHEHETSGNDPTDVDIDQAHSDAETTEPVAEDSAHQSHDDAAPAASADAEVEQHGSSFASTALMLLVGALVVAGLTLWAAPKLAPHLPSGIAQYLNPVPNSTQEEIAALQARMSDLDAQSAAVEGLTERLAALEASATDGVAFEEALTAAAEARQTAEAAASDASALRDSQAQIAAQVEGMQGELRALTEALSGEEEGSAVPAELQAALKALQSRVDDLSDATSTFASRDEVQGAIGVIETQIADVAAATEAAKLTGSEALTEAEQAVRGAALRGAAATLASRVNGGLPFAGALAELEELSGTTAPDALSDPAAAGLADVAALKAGFPAAARAAIDADRQAGAEGGAGAKIAAWFGSQVSSRPTVETEGEGVGAILSRVEARLNDGALPEALSEAESLPPHAQDAMAGWLSQLGARVEAEAALSDYIAAAGGAG